MSSPRARHLSVRTCLFGPVRDAIDATVDPDDNTRAAGHRELPG